MSAKGLGLKMLIISARPPPNLTDIRLTCSRERRNARSAALLRGPSRRPRQVQKALSTRCTQDEYAPPFWQIFPGIIYWQVLREKFFISSKRRERFRTRRLMKKFCNLINRRTRKSFLLYGWIALWCDPNSSVCVRIYLIFQEFTTCLLVKYTPLSF